MNFKKRKKNSIEEEEEEKSEAYRSFHNKIMDFK